MVFALKELNRVFKGFLDELMDKYYEIYKEVLTSAPIKTLTA
jgi:hypothetical protein